MTYRERELETIRRLRVQLEQRQLDRNAPAAQLHPDPVGTSEEEADVLHELTRL